MSYADPYQQQQHQQQYQHQQYGYDPNQPPGGYASHPSQSQSYDDLSYGEAPRYPSYPADGGADGSGHSVNNSGAFHAYPSTEKIIDDEAAGGGAGVAGTERAVRGRAGLNQQPTSSWANMGPPPRSTGILRMWRKDERGKQWFRGGGLRSGCRLFFCCGTITVIIIISVVLSILLYIHPPNVSLNNISLGSNPVTQTSDGFTVSISLGITVANPNWFNADFKEISAAVRYPGNDTNVFGGGELYNVDFVGYTASTFQFPLTLNYSTSLDPNRVVLDDIISKCGISGGTSQDLTIDYTLNLKLKILGVVIDPSISSSASFECPITSSDIENIIGSG